APFPLTPDPSPPRGEGRGNSSAGLPPLPRFGGEGSGVRGFDGDHPLTPRPPSPPGRGEGEFYRSPSPVGKLNPTKSPKRCGGSWSGLRCTRRRIRHSPYPVVHAMSASSPYNQPWFL